MKSNMQTRTIVALATVALTLPLLAQETPAGRSKVLGREQHLLVTATGTIDAIDYTNREVTLKDREGHTETIAVGPEVKRLAEAKVGDRVTVNYYLGFNAELRKPTPEEEANPIMAVEAAGRAGQDAPPAAGGVRRLKVVATIEGLDRPTQTVTVRGPLGRYFRARVADPSRLEQARIGETIVVTFTEAAAVSLKPAETKTQD